MTNTIFFTRAILDWHHSENDRELPWKKEKDPYKIWLSEIILQQTTSRQGEKYYEKFICRFPKVAHLAEAQEEEVYKMWEGLGYYSRCKNLLKTAKIISSEYNGIFPDDYKSLLALPGVGPYTASAIAGFAFDLPYAVLDGNVFRVLSRYFGKYTAIDTSEGKNNFQQLAQQLISKECPADYNQAIMDFGATVCTPRNPRCSSCALAPQCYVFQNSIDSNILPVKSKKTEKVKRFFNYFLIENADDEMYFEKRTEKDIWQNLYQPYLIETSEEVTGTDDLIKKVSSDFSLDDVLPSDIHFIGEHKQVLTHRIILSKMYQIKIKKHTISTELSGRFYSKKISKKLAFPQTIFSFMSKNPYF